MNINITNQIYNSIIIISFVNFFYMYTSKALRFAHSLQYFFPFVFVTATEKYANHILYPQNTREIVNCVTSSVHASVLVVCSYFFLNETIDTSIYDIVLDYSLVYNLYDMFFIIKYGSKIKNQMLFHHSLIILCILIKKYVDVPDNYYYYVALNFLSEITTVPLNWSWQLYLQKQTHTKLFVVFNIITLVLYVPFRIMLNMYLVYDQHFNLDTNLKYFQFLMMFLNFFWFYKMGKMVLRNCIKMYNNNI